MAAFSSICYFLNVFGSGIFRRPNVARIPTCPLLAFTHCLDGTVSLMIVIRMRRTQQSHQYSKKYTIHNSKILLEKLGRSPRIHPRGLLQFFQKAFWIVGKCEIRPRELSTASQPVNSLRCLFSFWNLFRTFVYWLINTWTDFWCKHRLHKQLIIK